MLYLIKLTFTKLKHSQRLTQFLVLISFLISFVIIRQITSLQKEGILPNQQGSLHIHHLVPGILLILISGYNGLSFWSKSTIRWTMSILFGIGAALTIDEFALWLYLKDVYWYKEGRQSIDAIIFTTAILIIVSLISEAHDHSWLKKLLKKFT